MKSMLKPVLAGALAVAAPAGATCTLSIMPVAEPTVTHDAFDPLATQMSFTVQVANSGDETCTPEIVLVPDGGELKLRSAVNILPYEFRSPAALSTGAEVRFGVLTVPAASSRTVTFDAEIPRSVAAPGMYRAAATFILRQAREPVVERVINLTALVAARAQMSISGTRSGNQSMGPALLDLGVLHDGSQGTVFVSVWANSAVRVRLRSENGGELKLTDRPAVSGIPYTVTFDGDQRSVAGNVELRRTPRISSDGETYPLTVSVPVVGPRYAGVYRDIITVSVDNY